MSGRGKSRKSVRARVTKTPYTGPETNAVGRKVRSRTSSSVTGASSSTAPASHAPPSDGSAHAEPVVSQPTINLLLDRIEEISRAQLQQHDTNRALLLEIAALKGPSTTFQAGATAAPAEFVEMPLMDAAESSLIMPDSQLTASTVIRDFSPPSRLVARPSQPLGVFLSETTPVGTFVVDKVKEDILLNKYINFKDLLLVEVVYSSSEEMEVTNSRGGLIFRKKKSPGIKSWNEWTKAWNVFVSLNSGLHPEDSALPQKMAIHFETVQSIQEQRKDWMYYDESFRRLLCDTTSSAAWGCVLSQHLNTALQRPDGTLRIPNQQKRGPQGMSGGSQQKSKNNVKVPRHWCFDFHSFGSSCTRASCIFHHSCFKCKGDHAAYTCDEPYFRPPPSQDRNPIPCLRPPSSLKKGPSSLPSPINIEGLAARLEMCDPFDKVYLLNGFRKGFDLGFRSRPNNNPNIANLRSAEENPDIMSAALHKELALGRIKGPFHSPPFPFFQVSPVGIVPKKDPNTFRMITHLSCPEGQSINDGINDLFAKVMYTSVQEAINIIIKEARGAFLSKADIKSAFRLIPICPEQYNLLCFKWQDAFYYDCCLPMGARSACNIFERFSTSLEHILKNEGVKSVVHYLDDFLFINCSYEACLKDLNCFESVAQDLNLPLAADKTILPTQVIQFLGLEIDTLNETVRLPEEKIIKCKGLINNMLDKSKCKLKELQILLGMLNFACSVIVPGRAFLQSLYPLISGLKRKHHFKRLTRQTKADLRMFLGFLDTYNGLSFYRSQMFLSPDAKHLYSDAAKSVGFGAWLKEHWISEHWPSEWWSLQNITFLELVPIVVALLTWGNSLKNSVLHVHTDNEALYYVIKKQYSKEPLVKMWIRKLVLLTLQHNILIEAHHISGDNNFLADHLSRLKTQQFLSLHLTANRLPTPTKKLPSFVKIEF